MDVGALPSQAISSLIDEGRIFSARKEHLQPSSLDLSLTEEVYRMKGTFLPRRGEPLRNLIASGALFSFSLSDIPLEWNGIYLIKLNESLDFPEDIFARSNNKSSTGRVNLQTRLLADGVPQFDRIPRGYRGELWLEMIPKSFPVKLVPGESLNQIRFFNGESHLDVQAYHRIHEQYGILYGPDGTPLVGDSFDLEGDGLTMTIYLDTELMGYHASPTRSKILDFGRKDYDPEEFFEPIHRSRHEELILKRGDFYIVFTKEYLRVPTEFAAEMVAYDPSKGEFRTHSAGFFDPGFGYGAAGEVKGAPAVLEVSSFDHDFVLRDGQPICKMVFERLTEFPDRIYGVGELGSHYADQDGPRLSKHFRRPS